MAMNNKADESATQAQNLDFIEGVQRLGRSNDLTDLMIVCKNRSWNMHKVVLCAQSDYFYKSCTGEFREAKEGKIILEDDEPTFVDALISHCYQNDYAAIPIIEDTTFVAFHIGVFTIADKYFVTPLKALAKQRLDHDLRTEWSVSGFALTKAVENIYLDTPIEELRDVVVTVAKDRVVDLLGQKDGDKLLKDLTRRYPHFGADLAVALASCRYHSPNIQGCRYPRCNKVFAVQRPPPDERLTRLTCPYNCDIYFSSMLTHVSDDQDVLHNGYVGGLWLERYKVTRSELQGV